MAKKARKSAKKARKSKKTAGVKRSRKTGSSRKTAASRKKTVRRRAPSRPSTPRKTSSRSTTSRKSSAKRPKKTASPRKAAPSVTRLRAKRSGSDARLAGARPNARLDAASLNERLSGATARRRRAFEALLPEAEETRGLGPESGGQSGDTEGLSRAEISDSESVEELVEEGQAFEAGLVDAVENAPEGEIRTREVPEDDVPQEYLDED